MIGSYDGGAEECDGDEGRREGRGRRFALRQEAQIGEVPTEHVGIRRRRRRLLRVLHRPLLRLPLLALRRLHQPQAPPHALRSSPPQVIP